MATWQAPKGVQTGTSQPRINSLSTTPKTCHLWEEEEFLPEHTGAKQHAGGSRKLGLLLLVWVGGLEI